MDKDSGTANKQGTGGYWWAQNASTDIGAQDLIIDGKYTYPGTNDYKTYGRSVRYIVFAVPV